jgi:hypothetical protein
MSFHSATPIKLLDAFDERISFLYFLSGGVHDGRIVLISSLARQDYEETSVFLCNDLEGDDVDWGNSLSTIPYVDTEDALNRIGYTTKISS